MGRMPSAARLVERASRGLQGQGCQREHEREGCEVLSSLPLWSRRSLLCGMAGWMVYALGCSSPLIRNSSKDKKVVVVEDEPKVLLVRDMARAMGMRPVAIEGVALATELFNTGSNPPPSPYRDILMGDMQRRGVKNPAAILASPTTSLVLVRAKLPPGVQKGDRLDVEVSSPSRSDTESLRNGWLMQTRLQEMAVLGNRLRQGQLMGYASGSILVESMLETATDARSETRGRVLGGAVSNTTRNLGLVLTSEHHSVRASSMIGAAVNNRLHTYDRGNQKGVATPKRDNLIELAVHHRYRNNLVRYVRVIQAIPVRESAQDLMERLTTLETQLFDPHSSLSAAVDLEAIGPEALPVLKKGLGASDALVRFASAEALAYMNEEIAVPALVASARYEPAFRWHALTALSSMTKPDARDGLAELLHEPSDETRYGAFQALVDFNPRDPVLRGEVLNQTLTLHEIPTDTEPLVHIRRTARPEIVLFGKNIAMVTPAVVFAGQKIMIKSEGDHRMKVSQFALGEQDTTKYCENNLATVIRTIAQLGGSYADIVAAVTEAKQKGYLAARLKFDALPKPGREYELDEEPELPEDIELDEVGEEEDAPSEFVQEA